jgi:dihydrofolate reductase
MRKLLVLVHISLDGFVAGPNGEFDGFPKGDENLGFICELTRTADAAFFGRVSYELLNSYWPNAKDLPGATQFEKEYSNWYNSAQKIVVSRTLQTDGVENSVVIANELAKHVTLIKQQPGKDILIFGSPSVTRVLIQEGLIDEYWVFVNPVLFGKGIPLFTEADGIRRLKLLGTKLFGNGELGLHYMNA